MASRLYRSTSHLAKLGWFALCYANVLADHESKKNKTTRPKWCNNYRKWFEAFRALKPKYHQITGYICHYYGCWGSDILQRQVYRNHNNDSGCIILRANFNKLWGVNVNQFADTRIRKFIHGQYHNTTCGWRPGVVLCCRHIHYSEMTASVLCSLITNLL